MSSITSNPTTTETGNRPRQRVLIAGALGLVVCRVISATHSVAAMVWGDLRRSSCIGDLAGRPTTALYRLRSCQVDHSLPIRSPRLSFKNRECLLNHTPG